jgi:hypothetical protein
MPQREIINTIKQLPLNERVELLEEISRSVSEELQANEVADNAEIYDNLTQAEAHMIAVMWKKRKEEAESARSEWHSDAATAQANESTQREQRLAAFHRLSGMLKTNEPPPTDQELKDDYVDYLEKKYS